jgi:hypothetical protein
MPEDPALKAAISNLIKSNREIENKLDAIITILQQMLELLKNQPRPV